MGTLKPFLVLAVLVCPAPLHAQTVADWRSHIAEASTRFGVPVAWIECVMHAESRGRTHVGGRPIRSSAGAMGLMQLMPGTWAEMRARLGLGSNPDNPRDNILAGTFYLRLMHDRFGYPGLFAAYNAGPKRYGDYLAGRSRLPTETVGYLASVAPKAAGAVLLPAQPAPPPTIFVVRRDVRADNPVEAKSASASPLFVTLSKQE